MTGVSSSRHDADEGSRAVGQVEDLALDLGDVPRIGGDPAGGGGLDAELHHRDDEQHRHQRGEGAVVLRAEQPGGQGGEDVRREVHHRHRHGDAGAAVADARRALGGRHRASLILAVAAGSRALVVAIRQARVRSVSDLAAPRSTGRLFEVVVEGLLVVDLPDAGDDTIRAVAADAAALAAGMPDLTRLGVRVAGALLWSACLVPARGHLARLPAQRRGRLLVRVGQAPPGGRVPPARAGDRAGLLLRSRGPPTDDRDLRRRRGRVGAWRGGHRSGVRPAGAEGAGARGGRPLRSRCRAAVLGGPDAPDVPRPRPDRRPRATLGRLRRGQVRRRGQRGQRGAVPPARCFRPRGVDVALRHRGPDTRGPRAVASRGGGAVSGSSREHRRCRPPPRCCVAAQNVWAGRASRCRAGPTSTRAAGRPCTRCSAPTSTTPRGRGARSGHARAYAGSRSQEEQYVASCASPVRRSAPTRSS